MTPLRLDPQGLPNGYADVAAGDAVVAFSRRAIYNARGVRVSRGSACLAHMHCCIPSVCSCTPTPLERLAVSCSVDIYEAASILTQQDCYGAASSSVAAQSSCWPALALCGDTGALDKAIMGIPVEPQNCLTCCPAGDRGCHRSQDLHRLWRTASRDTTAPGMCFDEGAGVEAGGAYHAPLGPCHTPQQPRCNHLQ
jgi:hypothetical protein